MKDEISSSSKLEDIKMEDFQKIQPYFMDKSVENTRIAFRIRTKLIKNIPGNLKICFKITLRDWNVAIVMKLWWHKATVWSARGWPLYVTASRWTTSATWWPSSGSWWSRGAGRRRTRTWVCSPARQTGWLDEIVRWYCNTICHVICTLNTDTDTDRQGRMPREIPRRSPASPRKIPFFLTLLLRFTFYF